jgi:hypothetical protein
VNRVRWYHARLPASLRSFAASLERLPVSVDSHMGFRIERIRRETLEAVYYERFNWTDQTIDPFGTVSAFERTSYKTLRFSMSKVFPELELIDPPRGLSSFFSRIAEITDFEATITPLAIDVAAWASALRKLNGLKFTISGITVSELNVEENISGRLTIVSRQKDVEEALARLLIRRTYSVQKLQLSMQNFPATGPLIISSDGSVQSQKELNLDVLEILRTTVPQNKSQRFAK